MIFDLFIGVFENLKQKTAKSRRSGPPGIPEGAGLEWNIFIGIFENLAKKDVKSMQKHENKLKIL